jgi:hypothetical protein
MCLSYNSSEFLITLTYDFLSFTGQEIDFLSLLKSFGFEMDSVARALGVDINTLNNMDKDVLLELLTSQGGTTTSK